MLLRFLYDIGFFVFAIFYLPLFFIKGKHKGGFSERFGMVPAAVKEKLSGKGSIWIHAVSVGEMAQGVRLADTLRKHYPESKFVLTSTTAAGKEIAEKFKRSDDTALYFPVDFSFSVKAFIRAVSPKMVIILETEIWPNLLAELSRKNIPVCIMNGRISDRAFPKYCSVRALLKPVLNRFTWIGVQDEAMRRRFVELGADPAKIEATGNMKYDWTPPAVKDGEVESIEKQRTPETVWCIAGSTHEGEEELLFDIYKALRAKYPSFRMLIAPRHLDRMASIEAQAFRRDLGLQKVSALLRSDGQPKGGDTVMILDKMGLLANLYRMADFVFIGGSLVPYGGHNLIEPAFYEKPVVFGRFMENFKEMASEFKRAGAALEAQDSEGLKSIFGRLIEDKTYRQELGKSGKRLIALHQGATERNIQAMIRNLKSQGSV